MAVLASTGCSDEDFKVTPIYNHANSRVVIQLNRSLSGSESLFVQARRGNFGVLDCTKLSKEIPALTETSGEEIDGPLVDAKLTKGFYGPEWGQGNPTPEMLASLAMGTDSIIDVCVMDGDKVVAQIERDLFEAWDQARKQGIGGKADDPSGEVRINSAQEYGVRCVAELGEIPFFEKTGEQEYGTYDCLESTPIPMTVTAADGSIKAPMEGTEPKCDAPQFIYDLCEAGPRVAQRTNDQGTRWVLLCRKSKGGYSSNQYNDIAMIGHNPFTGKTCFFQNALYQKTDGGKIPHPADKEKSTNLWSGVHGGEGSGIQCANCHDADPFIHTPWIDGAKDQAGRPIIPKMGIDADMALGALDTPYAIINLKGQGWKMPKQIVSQEANACLKCHRMGDGRWSDNWLKRLDNTDTSWNGIVTAKYNVPEHKYWMPTDVLFTTDAQWTASEYAKSLDFIQNCASNPTAAGCVWKDVPTSLDGGEGGGKLYNKVSLGDVELAKQATTILGMNKTAPTQVCAECHAPNQTTLREWQAKTNDALATCLKDNDSGIPKESNRNISVGKDEFETVGEYKVAQGATLSVVMTNTAGDPDLYVKRNGDVSETVYDCRPFTRGEGESCTEGQPAAANINLRGPARFTVGIRGFADGTKAKLKITYKEPDPNATPPKDVLACMKLEPDQADSPYTPAKLGIFSAAAHLGFFQDLFKSAYPEGEDGNTADTWALAYGKFKNRVSMPKGNHPRFSQKELDIVAEWFVRGLPRLTDNIAPDTGPTSCTPSVTSAVATHVSQMATQGWAATNKAAGMNMYGCTGSDPRGCLTNVPNASSKSYGTNWAKPGTTIRVLRELAFNTFYWMRSSADGRFVANGSTGGDGAVISDLQTGKDISVDAAYDPGFFPDGKGWMFQSTPIGTGFCTTSLLASNPDKINFSEAQCNSITGIALYQHMGQGLGGGDYFTVNGQFTSDNASGVLTRDPSAGFAATAQMKLTPMVFDGTHYVSKPQVTTNSPYEGDIVLSPSTRLTMSRFGNENGQLGYVLRRITTTPSGTTYTVTSSEVARYCTQGAKPSINFTENYAVTHHYVGPNDFAEYGYASAADPAFQEMLSKGTANIILINLATGVRTRVTTMKAGQYALFPHFRSDGWFYFLVRDKNTGKEYAVASDAALAL
jgi:mono/diheme cytochrome c family protein